MKNEGRNSIDWQQPVLRPWNDLDRGVTGGGGVSGACAPGTKIAEAQKDGLG